ncbi:hypothetical protein ABL78_8075 [Leptomonas seymouri]|uniref:Rubicon Homology domain-containing protein n=1 Tax=Leptomonas seymouri TaxID=5684 RepID=A0A0N1P9G3_LEPSE|nr:hypothetical protein ABL78_8075 [Leptomonas seymouri]|eukprot:KPI82912.1 hypothetical protein ABL78_8075 [Leptomonas seymouri]
MDESEDGGSGRRHRRSPSSASLQRSPANAYLSVRELLEEVMRQRGHSAKADSPSDVSLDFLTYPDTLRAVGAVCAHAAEARSASSSCGSNVMLQKHNPAARVLRRVQWLAQWTQNVLEAFPFTEDSDAESAHSDTALESNSFLWEAKLPEAKPTSVVASDCQQNWQLASSRSGGSCSTHAATALGETLESVQAAEPEAPAAADAHDEGGIALKANGAEPGNTECDSNAPPVERALSYRSEHGLRACTPISPRHELTKHQLQAELCAATGLPDLLTLRSPEVDEGVDLCRCSPVIDDNDEGCLRDGQRMGEGNAHLGASAALPLSIAAPPPPPTPLRGRPPLCRDAGLAYDVPSTPSEQRAVLLAQGSCCTHCGAALPMPTLGIYEHCCRLVNLIRAAGGGGGGGGGGGSACCCCCHSRREDEERGSSDDDVERGCNRGRRASATPRRADSTISAADADCNSSSRRRHRPWFSQRGAGGDDLHGNDDEEEDGITEDSQAGEQQALLARHRTASTQAANPLPPPKPNAARGPKLSPSPSYPAAAAATTVEPSPSPSTMAGGCFCVYEGRYLCPTCFYARPGASAAAPRGDERLVEPDAWQVRSAGRSRSGNSASVFNPYGSITDESNASGVSPVREAVTHAAGCLNRWWTTCQLAADPFTPAPFTAPPPAQRLSTPSAVASLPPQQAQQEQADAHHTCMIPAHVLLRWDFTRYPVSARAASILQRFSAPRKPCARLSGARGAATSTETSTSSFPVLYDISAVHPALYTRVPALAAASQLRKKMCLMHAQAWWCTRYRLEMWGVDGGSRADSSTRGVGRAEVWRGRHTDNARMAATATSPPRTAYANMTTAEPQNHVAAAECGSDNTRWSPSALRPPRCTPKRLYLVDRAEGWSLQDLYRLTTASAAASRPSERTPATATAADSHSERRAPAMESPPLLVELQSLYAVLRAHLDGCDYCRMHCRGLEERE